MAPLARSCAISGHGVSAAEDEVHLQQLGRDGLVHHITYHGIDVGAGADSRDGFADYGHLGLAHIGRRCPHQPVQVGGINCVMVYQQQLANAKVRQFMGDEGTGTSRAHHSDIDAATCSGMLSNAFCIQLSDSGATPSVEQLAFEKSVGENWPNPPTVPKPQRPMTYELATNRIYALPFDCFIGCQCRPHNDDCLLRQSDEIIEAWYLDDQISRGSEISRCFGLPDLEAAPYILDIDLDAFHTRRAINPKNPSTFYRLIKNAVAITIATEAECIEEEWLDDEDQMNSDELLQELLGHINKAL